MNKRNNIIAAFVAVLMVLLAVVFGLFVNKYKYYKPEIVVFGDSLIGNDRSEESVTSLLANETGKEVFNAGIGGSLMTKGMPSDNVMDHFNMVNLSDAILRGNCDVLLTLVPKYYLIQYDVISYAKDTIKKLGRVDFKTVQTVIIEQGTNDMLAGVSPETYSDAVNKTINNLKKINPDIRIIIVSPGYVYDSEQDNGILTEEYVKAGREVAERQSVGFVDFYHDSGINENNYEDYLYDGLHTNARGNRVLMELIVSAMDN